MDWNLTLGTTLEETEANVDRIMEGLARFSVAAHANSHAAGALAATITVGAATITDAIQTALIAATNADLGEITSLEVVATDVFDRESDASPIPELIGVNVAAKLLGRTNPTVRAWIQNGKLDAVYVEGSGWGITRASVDALTE